MTHKSVFILREVNKEKEKEKKNYNTKKNNNNHNRKVLLGFWCFS